MSYINNKSKINLLQYMCKLFSTIVAMAPQHKAVFSMLYANFFVTSTVLLITPFFQLWWNKNNEKIVLFLNGYKNKLFYYMQFWECVFNSLIVERIYRDRHETYYRSSKQYKTQKSLFYLKYINIKWTFKSTKFTLLRYIMYLYIF